MNPSSPSPVNRFPLPVEVVACATALGDEEQTLQALLRGKTGLRLAAVLGEDGGEEVPLALRAPMEVTAPPRWWADLLAFLEPLAGDGWGGPHRPVFMTSSNFGIDGLYGLARHRQQAYADWGTPHQIAARIQQSLGWGENVVLLSHACVSAQVGLYQSAQWIRSGVADKALVVSFDFVGPFVAAGFHALKILNSMMPAPYQVNQDGAIGLGDGMAYAIVGGDGPGPVIAAQALFNEMHHFTANAADGSGFSTALGALDPFFRGRRSWVKGHGTGTLEAGRLEAAAIHERLPGQPLVSWKGGLGHTLGSCALVELAIAIAAVQNGRIPGTVGTSGPCFIPDVRADSFAAGDFDSAILLSNAFGGAHAALLLTYG